MASLFVGRAIEVTLQQPANVGVQGVVANVIEQTTTLILRDAYFPADGRRLPFCSIEGSQIADIKLIEPGTAAAPPPPKAPYPALDVLPTAPGESTSAVPTPTQRQKPFVDPAVLSMGKRPPAQAQAPVEHQPSPFEAPTTPLKMAAATLPPKTTSPFVGEARRASVASGSRKKRNDPATLTAPFSGLAIADNADYVEADNTDEPIVLDSGVRRASVTKTRTGKPMDGPVEPTTQKKKVRKAKARKQEQLSHGTDVAVSLPEAARNQGPNEAFRGKGWRQTPMLKEASPAGKKTKRQKALEKEALNGWATEDATDIQDLPEFDFASNLSKFDKRSVFDQIRNEDTTADEERLVSFNRLPARPGTYGGKNFHPTENVLDGSTRGLRRDSMDSDSSDDFGFGSGRGSRRALSRASAKRVPLRSNSNLAEDSPAGAAASSGHVGLSSKVRAQASALGVPRTSYSSHSHSHGSPSLNPTRFTPPTSPTIERVGSFSTGSGQFRLSHSNRNCPYITPGGMLAVEETAEVEFGLTSAIMSENSGRGIAEVVLKTLNAGANRLTRETVKLNGRPVCLFMVGNHKAGARAIVCARHLLGRGVRVIVCVLGYERVAASAELDGELRQQLDILRKLGGSVRGWQDIHQWLQSPGSPAIEAVVDALLLTGGKLFEGLAPADQRHAIEAITWINSTAGRLVVSLNAPSGMNGSTGEFYRDPATNQQLCVLAKHIVSLGAPRLGLLRALQRIDSGEASNEVHLDCSYWVVDIGVNKAWRHFGAPEGKVVAFGGEWVVPIRFVEGAGG